MSKTKSTDIISNVKKELEKQKKANPEKYNKAKPVIKKK